MDAATVVAVLLSPRIWAAAAVDVQIELFSGRFLFVIFSHAIIKLLSTVFFVVFASHLNTKPTLISQKSNVAFPQMLPITRKLFRSSPSSTPSRLFSIPNFPNTSSRMLLSSPPPPQAPCRLLCFMPQRINADFRF